MSLYISGLSIEGHTYLNPLVKDSVELSFKGDRFNIDKLVDSLFSVYENIGFFNVRFNVRVDTISKDSVLVHVKPFIKCLPVIRNVKLEGMGFYRTLKNEYFPFENRVFKRRVLLESFATLKNSGWIESADYRFIKLSDREYTLFISLYPQDEFFQVQMLEEEGGMKGSISIRKTSIFSSGLSFSINAQVESDSAYYYNINLQSILPYVRGFFTGIRYYSSVGGIDIRGYTLSFKYVTPDFYIGFERTKKNGLSIYGSDITFFGKNVKFSIMGSYGNGRYITGNFASFKKSGLSFSAENMLMHDTKGSLLFLKLPLKNGVLFLDGSEKLNGIFLLRGNFRIYGNFSIFSDIFEISSKISFDAGVSYLREKTGFYVGYIVDEGKSDIRVGLVLGSANSLFERSMHIL